ncbi:hypothetical protein ACHAWF_016595 [Thalassiosira exigua]
MRSIALSLSLSLLRAASAAPTSWNGTLSQRIYAGKGCEEADFSGVDVTSSLVVVENNVFCEVDSFAGMEPQHSKFEVFCDAVAGTTTFRWRNCTAGCAECSAEWSPSGSWAYPTASWTDRDQGQCWSVNVLPPYDPEFNFTEMSYRYVNDTDGEEEIYKEVIVANSCLSDAEGGEDVVLRAALYEQHLFVEFDEAQNKWVGYDVDVANLLAGEAAKDGYNLKFDINDDVLTDDNSKDANYGLDYLVAGCPESGEGKCYDMIIGSFERTGERQTEVVFTPPILVAYLKPIVKKGSGIASLEDVAGANGSLCITEKDLLYSGFDLARDAPEVSTIQTCATPEDCLDMVLNGQCTLYMSYLLDSNLLVTRDEKYQDLEIVDQVIPKKDGSSGFNWISFPLSPDLSAGMTALLSQWMYRLYKSGALGDLQDKHFGFREDYSKYFPQEMSLTAGVYRNKPQAYQNDDGEWVGIVFDSAALLTEAAKKDGTNLNIVVDTRKGIVSGYTGELGTPTGALAFVAPDCDTNSTPVCFDMMLGAWSISPLRQALTTFTPPYMKSYVTTIRRPDGAYNTLQLANAAGAKVCLWAGSSMADAVTGMVQNPVECPTQDECYNMVKAGDCDMTVDDHASAVAREAQDPEGLFVTDVVVPGTTDYLAFPMKSNLDPTVQVAVTYWMHDYTSTLDLAAVGNEYLTEKHEDEHVNASQPGTAPPPSPESENQPPEPSTTPGSESQPPGPVSLGTLVGMHSWMNIAGVATGAILLFV